MNLSLLSAPHPSTGSRLRDRVTRPAAWAADARATEPAVAVLMTGSRDPAAAARAYRTVLPRARIFLYGHGLSPREADAARSAGAVVRPVPPSSRDALVRRMLSEVDADTYILAHGAGPEDVCVAPLIVAEVDAGRDLVDVARPGGGPAPDLARLLLRHAVDFAFGGHGAALDSDFKACSRRFALSYRRTAARPGRASARDLTLHALRLRLPVGEVTALASGGGAASEAAPDAAPGGVDAAMAAASTLATALRLLVDERPRRVLGSAGLALAAAGFAAATPVWAGDGPHASSSASAALALLGAGTVVGAAGLLLDVLGSARRQVRRLGAAAIPRRADRDPPPGPEIQSSVS